MPEIANSNQINPREMLDPLQGKGRTSLIFIDPKFVLRQALWTLHCFRRPHNSLAGASWVQPLKGGYCYDHVQLQTLSGYSSHITAL